MVKVNLPEMRWWALKRAVPTRMPANPIELKQRRVAQNSSTIMSETDHTENCFFELLLKKVL